MAISDNTSYELTGAQVKDLASKVKDNTVLAKNLAGGAGRADNTIFMCLIDSDDAAEIAAQMGGGSAGTIEIYMKYGFRLSGTGQWLDNTTLGELLEVNTPVIYKKKANAYDMNYEQDIAVIGFDAGYNQDEGDYFPKIRLMYHYWNTSNLGGFNILEVTLKAPEQSGVWYEVDETTLDTITTPYCIIRPSSGAFIQQLADEYNEAHADPEDPSSYISLTDVKDLVPFMFIGRNGAVLRTTRGIGQSLRNTRVVVFDSDQDGMGTLGMPILGDHNGSNTNATFSLYFPGLGVYRNFNVHTGQSSEGQYAQYMPYVIADDGYSIQYPWAYADDVESSSALSSTPDSKYAIAKDANNNLYMAADASSTSDWKQINNDAIAVPVLYTTTGQNTDGAVTQKLFTDTVGNVETILQTLNSGAGAQ